MKVFDKDYNILKSKAGKGQRATKRHLMFVFNAVTEDSIKALEGSGELLRLQEIKDELCEMKGNPFNMNLTPGHANAKVRSWCLTLVTRGTRTEVDGKIEFQRIDAFEIGDAVVYANLQAMRHRLAKEKSEKKKEAMQKRYEAIAKLPRRETYYKK